MATICALLALLFHHCLLIFCLNACFYRAPTWRGHGCGSATCLPLCWNDRACRLAFALLSGLLWTTCAASLHLAVGWVTTLCLLCCFPSLTLWTFLCILLGPAAAAASHFLHFLHEGLVRLVHILLLPHCGGCPFSLPLWLVSVLFRPPQDGTPDMLYAPLLFCHACRVFCAMPAPHLPLPGGWKTMLCALKPYATMARLLCCGGFKHCYIKYLFYLPASCAPGYSIFIHSPTWRLLRVSHSSPGSLSAAYWISACHGLLLFCCGSFSSAADSVSAFSCCSCSWTFSMRSALFSLMLFYSGCCHRFSGATCCSHALAAAYCHLPALCNASLDSVHALVWFHCVTSLTTIATKTMLLQRYSAA